LFSAPCRHRLLALGAGERLGLLGFRAGAADLGGGAAEFLSNAVCSTRFASSVAIWRRAPRAPR
jgi:hypothetical protein